MPQFTRYKTTSYGSRLMKSVGGVVLGFILFIASFGVLYWNEGRFDLSLLAETATEVSADTANADVSLDGALVSTTGTLTSSETLGDGLFLVAGDYVAVKRTVEMYAWVESSRTDTQENLGGSETSATTYTYKQEWTENPQDSSNFAEPGYSNPEKLYESDEVRVKSANVGVYGLDIASVDLPSFTSITLTEDMVTLNEYAVLASDQYIFDGYGSLTSPVTGDVRVSYSVVKSGVPVTAFAKLDGAQLSSYSDADGNTLFRLFDGTRDEAIAQLHLEFTTTTWILRVVGFMMMWIGMGMLFEPLSVLLSVIPIFSAISRVLFTVATFVIAFVLSLVTIFVSMIVHNVVVLVIVMGGLIGGIFYVLNKKRKEKGLKMPSLKEMMTPPAAPAQPSAPAVPTPPSAVS